MSDKIIRFVFLKAFFFIYSLKIFSEKIQINDVNPKVDARIPGHKPVGGDKPIFNEKIEFVADKPKIDARIPGYKPGGGDKKVILNLW